LRGIMQVLIKHNTAWGTAFCLSNYQKGKISMTPQDVRKICDNNVTVPLWPQAGRALGLGRNATYEAAQLGKIATVDVGYRKRVPTSWLRAKLGLEAA
jgi:hypothetical protein